MKTILFTLALLLTINCQAEVDFCQQYRDKLYDLLDQVDNHIKGNRVITVCNILDQAEYYNHQLIVKCNDQVAEKQTLKHLAGMKQYYCKGLK